MSEHKITALVTGASAGIGAEFCRQLAGPCDVIIATGRRASALDALAEELRPTCEVHTLVADLATLEGRVRVIECLRQKGPPDYLVNNAGLGVMGLFDEVELDEQLDMLRVHIDATLALCRAAIPFMKERGSGAIINVSSLSAFDPAPRAPLYSASKVFLNNFSESIQIELKKSGVRVQALCPGFTVTEFHDRETMANFDRNWVPPDDWMSAEAVVRESLAALDGDAVVVVPGEANRETARAGLTRSLEQLS